MKKIRIENWKNHLIELIVVFLGVTAGFILNNWRMAEQEQKLEEKYLSAFLEDANYNLEELNKLIETDSLWLNEMTPMILSIKNKTLTIDSAQKIMPKIVQIYRLELRTGTYEDITNSGNFNILNDFRLKSQIVDFHLEIKGVLFLEDYFYRLFYDTVMPFVLSEYSVVWGKFNDEKIIYDIEFSNVVAGYFSMVQQRCSAYQKLAKSCKDLTNTLNQHVSDD